jgi:hypothetical protein
MLRIALRALLLAVTLVGAYSARADEAPCWTYYDPPEGHCGGPGGCEDYYPKTECWVGCTSGSCDSDGNSTDCCGSTFRFASGYDDGGQTDCQGLYCGESPARATHIQKLRGSLVKASFKRDLDAVSSARLARVVFVPDRCTHAYDVVLENFPPLPKRKGL